MWVESQPGHGSQFHFTIPFAVPAAPPAQAPPRQVLDLEGMPVLVVEQRPTNRRILDEILTTWGMRPTAVDGGVAGLEAMELAHQTGRPFPLVLLDCQMPDMRRLRRGRADCAASAPHRGDDHDAVVGGATGGRHALPGRWAWPPTSPSPSASPSCCAAILARPGQARPRHGAHADHAPFPARSPGPGARHAAQGQRG